MLSDRERTEYDPVAYMQALFDHIKISGGRIKSTRINHQNAFENSEQVKVKDPATGRVSLQPFKPLHPKNKKFVSVMYKADLERPFFSSGEAEYRRR